MHVRTALTAVLGAAVTGLTAVVMVASPAAAATAPTISAPSVRTGYGTVTLTGTAPAGATVTLYESAYNWNDLKVAEDWQGDGGPVTTKASSAGSYQIIRYVDTGFLFAVEAGGLMSSTALVKVQALPMLTITSPATGAVNVSVTASPNQPHLMTHIQRSANGTTWTTVAGDHTNSLGMYSVSLTGQGTGTQYFRALIDADTTTNITSGYSAVVQVNLGGSPSTPTTPPVTPTPTTPPVTPKPTTPPSPRPTTPAPTKPPTAPGTASVQFTKIQYDSAGRDTGSNASINGEWFRLTNRTTKTVNLKNWTVRDAAGHLYRFTGDHRLAAGRSVYVRTGKGTNGKPADTRYWGSARYVWNNSGDTATLRNSANSTVDTCRWTSDKNVTSC